MLNLLGIMRPWEEGRTSSLFAAASPEYITDTSGTYLDHKSKAQTPNAATDDVGEREKLENDR